MSADRVAVLSIGGFDPSGGAGVLADVKTFEQHSLLGMAVNTANTVQNESEFASVNWLKEELIIDQLLMLTKKYDFKALKVGLIPSFDLIERFRTVLSEVPIVWDPVLSASAGFDMEHGLDAFKNVLTYIDLITPNWEEVIRLTDEADGLKAAQKLAQQTKVLLKGGHNKDKTGVDFLFENGSIQELNPDSGDFYPKHGSGCVLSSAIVANLALGKNLKEACVLAKAYTAQFLKSNKTLLGYHQ